MYFTNAFPTFLWICGNLLFPFWISLFQVSGMKGPFSGVSMKKGWLIRRCCLLSGLELVLMLRRMTLRRIAKNLNRSEGEELEGADIAPLLCSCIIYSTHLAFDVILILLLFTHYCISSVTYHNLLANQNEVSYLIFFTINLY